MIEYSPLEDRPLKILLVDDAESNRMLVKAFCKKTAFQITEADTGVVAVEKFKEGLFDLVLMDIQMPEMDGYTATGEIRKWELIQNRRATPIIALTANGEDDSIKSIQSGCNAHITKPVRKNMLFDTIKLFF